MVSVFGGPGAENHGTPVKRHYSTLQKVTILAILTLVDTENRTRVSRDISSLFDVFGNLSKAMAQLPDDFEWQDYPRCVLRGSVQNQIKGIAGFRFPGTCTHNGPWARCPAALCAGTFLRKSVSLGYVGSI